MPNFKNILVIGSRTFNNYYLLYYYLNQYIPKHANIISGDAVVGTDVLTNIYAMCNNHTIDRYSLDWNKYGKSARYNRDIELISNCDHCVAFWDGISSSTKHMIDLVKEHDRNVITIPFTENDIIKHHLNVMNVNYEDFDIYCGDKTNVFEQSLFFNPYTISDKYNRDQVLALYTDYLLKDPAILSRISDLKDKKLGCWCSPQLCHCDVILWLLDNAMSYVSEVVKNSEEPKKQVNIHYELLPSSFKKTGERRTLATLKGTTLAYGYQRVFMYYNRYYVEVKSTDIIREHIHQRIDNDNDDINDKYYSNDSLRCPVIRRNAEIDDTFKLGYWYIPIKFLKA